MQLLGGCGWETAEPPSTLPPGPSMVLGREHANGAPLGLGSLVQINGGR